MPVFQRRQASSAQVGLACVSSTGLEVSLRHLFQDGVVQRQVGHQLLQPSVLFLKALQSLGLFYTHAAVLFTPAIVGLSSDTDLPAGFGDRDTLVNVDLSFS